MPELSEWLKIMLGEVARKRDEVARDAQEAQTRATDAVPSGTQPVVDSSP